MALAYKNLLLQFSSSLMELFKNIEFRMFSYHWKFYNLYRSQRNEWPLADNVEKEIILLYRNHLSNWLTPGWLPLWANNMASVWSFVGNVILSLFINMFFSVIVISTRIGLNFFNSSGDFFIIQFCPFQIIVISYVNTGSSLVALAIDAIPILSINGVV